nr:transposase [Salinimonas lutimaris]
MPTPRKAQISLSDTPYYHCVSRCVRRAFLCGKDKLTGQSYEHRRGWVEQRLLFLGKIFAIDICAYAVMSNHTHLVLHVNKEQALSWTTTEIIQRWHRLHKGTLLTHRYINTHDRSHMSTCELNAVEEIASVYRQRLYDISWFMRLLNEFIARRANKEDGCTGRFWEGRFKSQALLDEGSLAACMAYVDLNPVRSNISATPENSQHTSIKKRITAARLNLQPQTLFPMSDNSDGGKDNQLPFRYADYIKLVSVTADEMASEKSGVIDEMASFYEGFGLNQAQFQWLVAGVETQFASKISIDLCKRKWRSQKMQRTG